MEGFGGGVSFSLIRPTPEIVLRCHSSQSPKFLWPERERENERTNMERQNKAEEGMEEGQVGPSSGESADDGQVGSSLTLERVAAAKQFIEGHYKAQMKLIQDRKQRLNQ